MAGTLLRYLFVVLVAIVALQSGSAAANFYKNTVCVWGGDNCAMSDKGNSLALTLNKYSGAAIQTKKSYLFGSMETQIKLVPGNSAGTVTAYYMSSTGDKHDEIDFEFLGNVSGQPYTIHTNVFAQGVGSREQQFRPWFDPTTGFHNYTIHWNPTHIVWLIDGVVIRVFRNYESMGIPYPNRQPMRAYSSIWNADSWATQGGRVKTDWSCAPFVANYRQFRPRTCLWTGSGSVSQCAANTTANWWTSPAYGRLSYAQAGQMNWVRNNYLIYDYCRDTARFGKQMPPECSLQQI